MALTRAAKTDDVLLSIHQRRIGLTGDGQPGSSNCLIVDGAVAFSTRGSIRKVQAGSNGVGAVTLAGAVIGDTVENVANLTTPGDVTSSFEATISVAGQIQQTAVTNLSAAQLLFMVKAQS